ncbi:hypothetical protein GEMRC1_003348 [Eukaryota sp. GEM-RC1]
MSYQTTPSVKFPVLEVESLLREKVSSFLKDKHYSVDDTSTWTRGLADSIRDDLTSITPERYKYIVQVTLAENRNQGVYHSAQFVWDEDSDRLANFFSSTDSLLCGVSVYAFYTY